MFIILLYIIIDPISLLNTKFFNLFFDLVSQFIHRLTARTYTTTLLYFMSMSHFNSINILTESVYHLLMIDFLIFLADAKQQDGEKTNMVSKHR